MRHGKISYATRKPNRNELKEYSAVKTIEYRFDDVSKDPILKKYWGADIVVGKSWIDEFGFEMKYETKLIK